MSYNEIAIRRPDEIHLEALPYRYPMRNAVTLEAELRQIEITMAQGYPQLALSPLRDGWLSVVGFGPSLGETWTQITRPCITVGGAHDFLLAHGLVPDWHAECDGRDHKTKHLEHPHPDVIYLMATICNPRMWTQLRDHRVVTWHNANGRHVLDWIGAHDPGGIVLAGGSVIGLTAIHLGGLLGFRRFRLFGFDGNFRGDVRHAGEHYGPPQQRIERTANGRMWATTPQMANACDELIWLLRDSPISVEVYGDSLQADVLKDHLRVQAMWRDLAGSVRDEYDSVKADRRAADDRRAQARFNTGSIPLDTSLLLRALSRRLRPAVVVEIGTFIGNSTVALAAGAGHVYTCDKDNDCLPASATITTHPYQTSTQMLGALTEKGLKAELFFFDGRIQPPDLALILRLSRPTTVYAFDDWRAEEKGTINVRMLLPYLPDHALVPPFSGASSLALLLPQWRLP